MAIFKKTFTPKVDKLSFKEVAKKSGLVNLSSKKFKDQATVVLHKSGMAKSSIKGILSGTKKVQPATLKKVFKKLSEGRVVKSYQGSALVADYVEDVKKRQIKMHNYKLSLRRQALTEEKNNKSQTKDQPAADDKKSVPLKFSATGPIKEKSGQKMLLERDNFLNQENKITELPPIIKGQKTNNRALPINQASTEAEKPLPCDMAID